MAQEINVKQTDIQNSVLVTDWRFLVRETRKIDPSLIKQFKANAKEIGRPVEDAVRKGIPSRRPMRGFEPKDVPGRLTWGGRMPVTKTQLKIDTRIRKRGKSIVSVWVMSPAVVLADMAKNRGRSGRKTREYPYSKSPTGYRRHTVNGQGQAMINRLQTTSGMKAKNPSRFVWPSALAALGNVNHKMYQLIDQTSRRLNAEIRNGAK